jgi:hypothetical protein
MNITKIEKMNDIKYITISFRLIDFIIDVVAKKLEKYQKMMMKIYFNENQKYKILYVYKHPDIKLNLEICNHYIFYN